MKQYDGTGTSGTDLARLDEAAPVVIVRTGHRVLDAALASDRAAEPSFDVQHAGARRAADFRSVRHDRPAGTVGTIVDSMSRTPDRDGAGDTLHAGTTHQIKAASGRSITVRVWHELATHGCN